MAEAPFWRTKPLTKMTRKEWESLCDGCGKCCLHKIEDFLSGEISYTNVACRLLDCDTCRCTDYKNRTKKVHDCVELTAENISELRWMPSTCAYRLLAEGKDLPEWHPLITGDPESVERAGHSIRGRVVEEDAVEDIGDYIVTWPK
jgi:uncharacterized cysteine cluster protein YcgN (CxxCxxCC family)